MDARLRTIHCDEDVLFCTSNECENMTPHPTIDERAIGCWSTQWINNNHCRVDACGFEQGIDICCIEVMHDQMTHDENV